MPNQLVIIGHLQYLGNITSLINNDMFTILNKNLTYKIAPKIFSQIDIVS